MEQKKHEAENMPIGLMMSLAMHGDAMHEFSLLNDEQQKSVIHFVENAKTGEDAKNRIEEAVQHLENGDTKPYL